MPSASERVVQGMRGRGVSFATVHGNQAILEAAGREKGEVKILAVTVLTSLDRGDLDDLGFQCDVEKLVLSRARQALAAGCDGIISSGLEAPIIRAELPETTKPRLYPTAGYLNYTAPKADPAALRCRGRRR